MQIELSLTEAEQKAILHYNETIEGFAQQVIEDRARQYMKHLVEEYRSEDIETVVNALPIKTKVEIDAEKLVVKPIELIKEK